MADENHVLKIFAPVSGSVMPIDQVQDPVFSQKMMGDGLGIEPTEGKIIAPVDATVTLIAETKHALGFRTDDGVEILIHLGIDTVELKGKPFKIDLEADSKVMAGDVIGTMDLKQIKDAGKQSTVMLVITNTATKLAELNLSTKEAVAGDLVAKALIKLDSNEPTKEVAIDPNEDKYNRIAREVINDVGGAANVDSLIHCITRLRFYLKDEDIPDDNKIREIKGVIDVARAQGQYQVVIGQEVSDVYDAAIGQLGPKFSDDEGTAQAIKDTMPKKEENLSLWGKIKKGFSDLVGTITGAMTPIIGALAAAGIIKGLLAFVSMTIPGNKVFPLVNTASVPYQVINAMGDSVFIFLPILVGITMARKMKSDVIIAAAIGGVLVHPSFAALVTKGSDLYSIGSLHVPVQGYGYSIFPMILAIWMAAKVEKWFHNHLPSYLRMIFVPMFTILIVSAITLYITGPAILLLSKGLSGGVSWLLQTSSGFGGLIVGGFYQVLVIFGLHWGLAPIALTEFSTSGFSYWNAIVSPTMIGQGAAVLAVALKTRDPELKELGIGAAISGFAGVTEPAIYGVNLKYRRVFISGLIGSAVGGAITGFLHGKMWGFAGSWIGFASFINPKGGIDASFYTFLWTSIATTVVAFIVTWVWGFNDKMVAELKEKQSSGQA